ncbi:hypothetical protein BCR43DRAFT_497485 [Syncephalastrum racemosum]|uniref:GRIP domain-containing protein n=1 Tax=Syncephalastrum racemosum TaxID=13706 RepID=A0A1X2H294_SYNRA|nr:hypothetical protein BCR43DRAFT_497485 [Syncephalastrum racemosum]
MVNRKTRQHQKLQEEIARLGNENEELKLEREESKKNVIHFMQEADVARQELRKAQALIAELTGSEGPNVENETAAGLVTSLGVLQACDASTNTEEREALQVLEDRWRESESQLEQAEARIQSLDRELQQFRQKSWENRAPVIKAELDIKSRELEKVLADQARERASYKTQLEQSAISAQEWHEKHDRLQEIMSKYVALEDQHKALEEAHVREGHLKAINKALREEIRKATSHEEKEINLAYLRNVVIMFFEKKQMQAQLIPVLSTLLQCSSEEQTRLSKCVRNKQP